MKHLVQKQLAQSIATLQAVLADENISDTLVTIAELTAQAMKSGHKLLVAGNGGSAADAQHLVAEFVVRLTENRPALRAIALTTDTSILTACGNDSASTSSSPARSKPSANPATSSSASPPPATPTTSSTPSTRPKKSASSPSASPATAAARCATSATTTSSSPPPSP